MRNLVNSRHVLLDVCHPRMAAITVAASIRFHVAAGVDCAGLHGVEELPPDRTRILAAIVRDPRAWRW